MGKFVTGPKILWKVIVRELHQLVSRPIYLFSIVIAPLLSYAFFLSLMDNGLPEELPTAVVDLDHSATSRNLTRQFTTVSSLSITTEYTSFTEARKAMQKSEIFGFVIIPKPTFTPTAGQKSLIIPTARISYPAPWNSAASRRRQHLQPQQRYSRHCSPVVNTNATSCRRYNPLP